jgi:hypothetical protein
MSDEKISQMPSAGALNGADIFPIVRNGQNYSGTAAAMAALAGGGGSPFVTTRSEVANYNVLSTDSATYFDNGGASGAVVFTLPPVSPGLNFHFTVVTGQSLEVAAPAGVRIALGVNNSAPGGNLSSNLPFSAIFVYAPAGVANQWIAESNTGGWDVA